MAHDYISRDREHLAGFYKAARYAQVEIHTIGRGKVDAMTLGLSSMMCAMFLEELSDKVRRGIEGKVLLGLSGGGRIYGYRPGTDARGASMKGALAIDQIEAAIVRGIFRDYAAGLSPVQIASRLNAVDAELKELKGKRGEIVPPDVELPDDLPELYRALSATLPPRSRKRLSQAVPPTSCTNSSITSWWIGTKAPTATV